MQKHEELVRNLVEASKGSGKEADEAGAAAITELGIFVLEKLCIIADSMKAIADAYAPDVRAKDSGLNQFIAGLPVPPKDEADAE